MNESPFKSFIDLITFDHALAALKAQEQKIAKELQVFHGQEAKLRATLEEAKKGAHDAQKEVDSKELSMEELVQAEARHKKRLENVTNHKEYQSIKREIDTIQTRQRTIESELLEAWATLETAQKAYETVKNSTQMSLDQLGKEIAQKDAAKSLLEADVREKQEQRPAKERLVPTEWLEKYAAMRASTPDPVVPVVQGSCSACYYKVSEPDIIALRRHKLLQCKGCYRFLYSESAVTPDQV